MAKYVGEFGKRWDERVPRSAISWLMNRLHVSATDEEITADIQKRCTAPGYTETLIQQSIAYALICHHHNQGLYRDVMRGTL